MNHYLGIDTETATEVLHRYGYPKERVALILLSANEDGDSLTPSWFVMHNHDSHTYNLIRRHSTRYVPNQV